MKFNALLPIPWAGMKRVPYLVCYFIPNPRHVWPFLLRELRSNMIWAISITLTYETSTLSWEGSLTYMWYCLEDVIKYVIHFFSFNKVMQNCTSYENHCLLFNWVSIMLFKYLKSRFPFAECPSDHRSQWGMSVVKYVFLMTKTPHLTAKLLNVIGPPSIWSKKAIGICVPIIN